jgi:hypothetical protein
MSGKFESPITNLDAVTASTDGEWVNCAAASEVMVCADASDVTDGAVFLVQGNTQADGEGVTVQLSSDTMDTNGSSFTYCVPGTNTPVFPAIRTIVGSYTDGTFTTQIIRRMP